MVELLQLISVVAILKLDDKYLLVQRNVVDTIFPGKWQNVGGKVELGETVEYALRREVREELNITLAKKTTLTFVQSYSWKKNSDAPVRLGLIFLINLDKEPKKIKINSELQSYGWFTLREVKKLDTIGKNSPTGTIGQIKCSNKDCTCS